jgi:hypothetical protein
MINRNFPRKSEVTKRLLAVVATMTLLSCHASAAALKTIEWFDELQCSSSIKFDPRKYDEERLRNTIAVIFAGGLTGDPFPNLFPVIPIHPEDPASLRLDQYQQLCEATIRRASDLPVIDLPGIELYRKLKLEGLDDQCKFGAVEIRAAAGEPSALRSYTPSADDCADFIDALEGKVDPMTFWHQLVYSSCRGNASPSACRAYSFSHEGDADVMDRARWEILQYGWTHCSTAYLKSNIDQKRSDEMRAALEREFRRRFKIKAPPCSHE